MLELLALLPSPEQISRIGKGLPGIAGISLGSACCAGASLLVVGAWLAVDMTMGSGVKFLWQYFSPATSMVHMVPLAAGVISGEVCTSLPRLEPCVLCCFSRL